MSETKQAFFPYIVYILGDNVKTNFHNTIFLQVIIVVSILLQ